MHADRQAAEIVLHVVDPRGTRVPNALISLLRDQHIQAGGPTNDAGLLQLDGLCAGSYVLEVAAQGFQIYRETIKLKARSVSNIEIRLDPTVSQKTVSTETLNAVTVSGRQTAGIAVVVVDPTGAVIPRAKIELKPENGELLAKGLANEAGSITLTGLFAGSYTMEVSAYGFKPRQEKIQAEADKITNLQVKLDVPPTINCSPCVIAPILETAPAEPIPYIRVVSLPCDQPNFLRRFFAKLFHKNP